MNNKQTIVVALGGNALSKDGQARAEDQSAVAYQTTGYLLSLLRAGHKLAIVHGNGPQVGNIILHEEAINTDQVPTMPLDVCGAMSQGQIGYWLQNQIGNRLIEAGLPNRSVVSLVTQVVVDINDPAFANPTKPIGPFYSDAAEAERLAKERGFTVKEDAGRGWRRVVASPRPIDIIEADFIKQSIDQNVIVISTGGGGIPVKLDGQRLVGVEAVIDKDFAAEKLAELVAADTLLILTAVDAVKINFGQPTEQTINQMSVDEAKGYIATNQFAPGSMLPKIEAAIMFAQSGPGRQVIITSPEKIELALAGQAGTRITDKGGRDV